MSQLSPAEIAQVAYDAGFRGDGLRTAVAVALAESAGDPKAHNDTYPDNSYGLWQINMLGAMGPERREQFGLESNRELFQPDENAKAAVEISSGGKNWSPWTTYTSGAYRQYLDDAQRAVAKVDRDGGGKPSGGKGPDRVSAASLIGDAKGGYRVDPDALDAYARRGHRVADELHALAKRELADVKHTAVNGFGKAGAESGFAAALEAFAVELRHQSRALGNRADALATATHRVSKAYRQREDETARDLREHRP